MQKAGAVGVPIGSGSYKHTTVMEKEDLMQQAFFGFKRAIEQYDPQRGVLFMTYASFWVKQSAQRHFMDCGNVKRIPVWMKEQMSKYFAFVAEWRKTNSGNKPPIPLLMEHLGLSEQKVLLLEQFIAEMNCQSLQDVLPGEDDLTVEDSVSSDYCLEDTVVDAMVQEQEAAVIWGEVDNLPGRQGEIIRKNFQENMSLKEIAEQQKVTFQRIQQLEISAFRSLRRNIRLNELKEKYGYGCSMAYHFGVKKAVDGHTSSTEALLLQIP